ncbi:MAG: hypothetical protein ACPGRC_05505 [Salibacteraceae bacterium]
MKGASSLIFVVLIVVIIVLGFYNFKQQQTINLLNEEIFEQAKRRHNLVLEKHVLELKLEKMKPDSFQGN